MLASCRFTRIRRNDASTSTNTIEWKSFHFLVLVLMLASLCRTCKPARRKHKRKHKALMLASHRFTRRFLVLMLASYVNVNLICLPTEHQRALWELVQRWPCIPGRIGIEMLVFVEGGKPENPEKNPRSRDENQQQTQPTYDVESGNRTRQRVLSPPHHSCPTTPPPPPPTCPIPISTIYQILGPVVFNPCSLQISDYSENERDSKMSYLCIELK